jgi:hypothetical protein
VAHSATRPRPECDVVQNIPLRSGQTPTLGQNVSQCARTPEYQRASDRPNQRTRSLTSPHRSFHRPSTAVREASDRTSLLSRSRSLLRSAVRPSPHQSAFRRTRPLKYRVQSPPCARPSCPPRGSQCACATMLGAALRLRVRVLRRRRSHRGRRRGRRSLGRVGDDDDDEGGREPVLLVSGMGGSVLHARRRSNSKFDLRVWVRILFANLDFKKYLWSLYNADTGRLPCLASQLCYLYFVAMLYATWGRGCPSSGV